MGRNHRDPRGRARSGDGSAGVRLQSDGPRGADQGPGRRDVRTHCYEAETCDDSLIDGHYYANKAPASRCSRRRGRGRCHCLGQGPTTTAPRALGDDAGTVERQPVADDALGHGVAALALMLLRAVSPTTSRPATAPCRPSPWVSPPLRAFAFIVWRAAGLRLWPSSPSDDVLVAVDDGRGRAPCRAGDRGRVPAGARGTRCAGGLPRLQRPVARRLLAYCGGVAVGVLPLLVYDAVAFGNPFELSYAGSQIGEHERGFYGVVWPGPARRGGASAVEKACLTLTPVVAAGVAGSWPSSGGVTAEAAPGAPVVAFLTYNAGFPEPRRLGACGRASLRPRVAVRRAWLAAAYAERAVVVLASRAVARLHGGGHGDEPDDPGRWPTPMARRAAGTASSPRPVSLVATRGDCDKAPFSSPSSRWGLCSPSSRCRRHGFAAPTSARQASPSSSGPSRETPGSTCWGRSCRGRLGGARRLRPAARRIVRGGAARASWRGRLVLLAVAPARDRGAGGGDHTVLSLALVVMSMLLSSRQPERGRRRFRRESRP